MRAMRWLAAALLVVVALLAAPAGADERAQLARVVDGDTVELTSERRVRLLQIDTPEVGSGECYSQAAARELRRLVPVGSALRLEADARLDRVDRYDRLLRYVHAGGRNVNVELGARGAAWAVGRVPRRLGSVRPGDDQPEGRARVVWPLRRVVSGRLHPAASA